MNDRERHDQNRVKYLKYFIRHLIRHKLYHNMPLKHEQRQKCDFYHVYMIFDVTNCTDGNFHWALFVRKTSKSVRCSKLTPLLTST